MQSPYAILSRLQDMARRETNSIQREIYKKTITHFKQIVQLGISAFKPEFQPRLYQSEAILKGTYPNNERTSVAVFDEMRTGKTLIALGRCEHLGVKKALIIVPAGVKRNWYEKIQEYYVNPPKTVIVEGGKKEQS